MVMVLGVIWAISGLHHGFFEILQGWNPTDGLIISSIGPAQQRWIHGTDEAFTIIPNFLLSGILSVLLSSIIIYWSTNCLYQRDAGRVFLSLFFGLFLVGGGIGFVPYFLLTWYSIRYIRNPIPGWIHKIPVVFQRIMDEGHKPLLFLTAIFFLIGLEISVFGFFPNVTDPDQILNICWSFLGISLFFLPLTILTGLVSEIKGQDLNH